MTEVTKFNGQKWIYERGNYQIIVENAWSLDLKTQERISVNGERIRDCIPVPQSILFWRTVFEDTVLDGADELNLKAQWKSGIMLVKARLQIDGKNEAWTDYFEAKWTGPIGEWPE